MIKNKITESYHIDNSLDPQPGFESQRVQGQEEETTLTLTIFTDILIGSLANNASKVI